MTKKKVRCVVCNESNSRANSILLSNEDHHGIICPSRNYIGNRWSCSKCFKTYIQCNRCKELIVNEPNPDYFTTDNGEKWYTCNICIHEVEILRSDLRVYNNLLAPPEVPNILTKQ